MKLILTIFSLLITCTIIGQTITDLPTAKAKAITENKLIILNFCNSCSSVCLRLDLMLRNDEFKMLQDRFVVVNIDIDQNDALIDLYMVTSTPRIFVQTITGDILLDQRGVKDPLHFLNLLNSFPIDYEELNNRSLSTMNKNVPPIKFYELGEAFRIKGLQVNNRFIRSSFLSISKMYYRKTEKVADSLELIQISMLSQLRIDIYQGRIRKVKKELSKIKIKNKSIKIIEMINFLKAYCYKSEGDTNEMLKAKEGVKDLELLKELEREK